MATSNGPNNVTRFGCSRYLFLATKMCIIGLRKGEERRGEEKARLGGAQRGEEFLCEWGCCM